MRRTFEFPLDMFGPSNPFESTLAELRESLAVAHRALEDADREIADLRIHL
jgi:hypothetical protein